MASRCTVCGTDFESASAANSHAVGFHRDPGAARHVGEEVQASPAPDSRPQVVPGDEADGAGPGVPA